MENIELLRRAKNYMEKLANGINPLTDEVLDDDNLINNVKLSRCFFYVTDVLASVIDNGGVGKKGARPKFTITDEELANYEYSDKPISITHIVKRINSLINPKVVRRLYFKNVTDWLVEVGLIEDAQGRYDSAKYCPTEQGYALGLSIEKRSSQSGEYYAVYYNRTAQEFIINHLQSFTGK